MLRLIDRVTVKGSQQPMDLYTVDLESEKLEVDFKEEDFSKLTPNEKRQSMVKAREQKEEIMIRLLKRELTTRQLFEADTSIRYMRINYRPDFYTRWNEGMDHYLQGRWSKARKVFEETLVGLGSYRNAFQAIRMAHLKRC